MGRRGSGLGEFGDRPAERGGGADHPSAGVRLPVSGRAEVTIRSGLLASSNQGRMGIGEVDLAVVGVAVEVSVGAAGRIPQQVTAHVVVVGHDALRVCAPPPAEGGSRTLSMVETVTSLPVRLYLLG
jgi:hypothetical protein